MSSFLPDIKVLNAIDSKSFDALLLVGDTCHLGLEGTTYPVTLGEYNVIDASNDIKLIRSSEAPGGRIVHAPTGPVSADFDDVRNFQDAATKCVTRALKAGSKTPLIVLPSSPRFQHTDLVTLLGAFHALYTPIEVREHKGNVSYKKVETLGVFAPKTKNVQGLIAQAIALESGRFIARDIGGSDPERMAAPKVAEYVKGIFEGTNVTVRIQSDPNLFENKYPLLAAVNRSAGKVPRHAGRIIQLEYIGEGPIEKTLMLVGKGITYDTGGADIKAGGVMAGMHRDKCGAAAVAGFFQMLSIYKPKHLKVVGAMAMVRNSVGSECYVSDEIILSRAGVRVRVGNTDAEGRMVMTDVLCEMKEKALKEKNPYLFTMATLTGHVIRCYGDNYTSLLDNGPARRDKVSELVSAAGEDIGEPCEVTRLRKEDFEFNSARNEYEDVVQANTKPSTMTDRGHMVPAAFMMVASGLDKHGCDSEKPLPYTHMDVAGSAGPYPGIPTGAPLLALAQAFVFK